MLLQGGSNGSRGLSSAIPHTLTTAYAQNARVDTARGKENDQQNLSKTIMLYRSV